ncbi:MAG: SH3 domain-containing protein [Mesorhizobium sp.]
MKGLFGFGSPKQRRFAMQFGYAVRPSFWQELKANSHLVIAAVGTMALLGVAGTALWLAMPSGDRPAFAEPKPQAEAAAEAPTAEQAETVAANPGTVAVDGASVVSSQVAPKADAVRPAETAEADIAALPRNDPRWTGEGKPPPAIDAKAVAVQTDDGAKTAFAEEGAATKGATAGDKTAADAANEQAAAAPSAGDEAAADSHADPDPKAATAAIPAARPEPPAEEAGAAANGHILRAVTMRSGPKKGAAAIGTIPAKTAVQVISCKSWCEVVYKGRHGFIYKSFVRRDG